MDPLEQCLARSKCSIITRHKYIITYDLIFISYYLRMSCLSSLFLIFSPAPFNAEVNHGLSSSFVLCVGNFIWPNGFS